MSEGNAGSPRRVAFHVSGHRRARALCVTLFGVVCLAGLGTALLWWFLQGGTSKEGSVRQVAQLLTRSPAAPHTPEAWKWSLSAFSAVPPQRRAEFWVLRSQSAAGPLQLAFFLTEALRRGDRQDPAFQKRLDFVLSYLQERPEACSQGLAELLLSLLPLKNQALTARTLTTLLSVPLRQGAAPVVDLLLAGAFSQEAHPTVLRVIAVHARAAELPKLWPYLRERSDTASLVVRKVLGEGGRMEPAEARRLALQGTDAAALELALRYFSLYGAASRRDELERIARSESLTLDVRRIAFKALALQRYPESFHVLREILAKGTFAEKAAALAALRLGTGYPFHPPGQEEVFLPQGPSEVELSRYMARHSGDLACEVLGTALKQVPDAFQSLTLRADRGQYRAGKPQQQLRKALSSFFTCPAAARPSVAYCAGQSLSQADLPLCEHALRTSLGPVTRRHLLWAAARIAGQKSIPFFTELLLNVDPASGVADEVAHLLKFGLVPLCPAPSPRKVVSLFPAPRDLMSDSRKRWRLALALRHFACPEAEQHLLVLAADPDLRVREAALFSVAHLRGISEKQLPPTPSSREAARLARTLLTAERSK